MEGRLYYNHTSYILLTCLLSLACDVWKVAHPSIFFKPVSAAAADRGCAAPRDRGHVAPLLQIVAPLFASRRPLSSNRRPLSSIRRPLFSSHRPLFQIIARFVSICRSFLKSSPPNLKLPPPCVHVVAPGFKPPTFSCTCLPCCTVRRTGKYRYIKGHCLQHLCARRVFKVNHRVVREI